MTRTQQHESTDEHVDGKPYGVVLIVPGLMQGRKQSLSAEQVFAQLPDTHKTFVERILSHFMENES